MAARRSVIPTSVTARFAPHTRARVLVHTLILKIVLTPTLIAWRACGRRFGPAVGGWLVGFPLTSAPVALSYAEPRPRLRRHGRGGHDAGPSRRRLCVAYSGSPAHRWPLPLAGAAWRCGVDCALGRVTCPPVPLFAMVVTALAAARCLMPGGGAFPARPGGPPRARWRHPAGTCGAHGRRQPLRRATHRHRAALGPQ